MKTSSLPSFILTIIREIGAITIDAFFNPIYAKRYGYTPTNFSSGSKAMYYNWNKSVSHLKNKDFIKRKGNIYHLTNRGEKEAFLCYLKNCRLKQQKTRHANFQWDGKWRIIFFDVPENKRRYRDELRSILKTIGFKEFQKSVWIYPYKVPNFLREILFEKEIKPYTRLITTASLERDDDIKKKFRL